MGIVSKNHLFPTTSDHIEPVPYPLKRLWRLQRLSNLLYPRESARTPIRGLQGQGRGLPAP